MKMVPTAGQEHFQTVGNEEVTFINLIKTFERRYWCPINMTRIRYTCSSKLSIAKLLISPTKTNI